MIRARVAPAAALTALLLVSPGCIEMDSHAKLEADGSGSLSMKIGLTEGMVAIVREMEKIDPDDDTVSQSEDMLLSKPDADAVARMKAAGLDLLDFESEDSETKLFSRFKVGFTKIAALAGMSEMEKEEDGKKSDKGFDEMLALRAEDDGSYTLFMKMENDDEDEGDEGDEIDFGDDDMGDDGPMSEEDAAKEAEKAAKGMELMGKMMGEAAKMSIQFGLEVPGEIVSFTPEQFATKDGSKVTWKMDFASMMAGGMGESNPMESGMSVRFRLPDGATFPESALTPAADDDDGDDGVDHDEADGDGDEMR